MDQNKMPKNLNNILQQISAIIPNYCDKCGARYERSDFEIINQDQNGISCRLDCKNCNNSYVMNINNPAEGMLAAKRANMRADITVEEMRKFANVDTIDNEEVLDALIALKGVRNISDLEKLLNN